MSNAPPLSALTLDDLHAALDALGPPRWVPVALIVSRDVETAVLAWAQRHEAPSPLSSLPEGLVMRVVPALVPGDAFVEERRGRSVRYRRLLPTTADVCDCACHGDTEDGPDHAAGDCCPALADADDALMAGLSIPLEPEPLTLDSFDGTVRFIARARRMLEDEAHQERHGPRNRRAYLAWVRRHTPKRRRFDGPTVRMLARDLRDAGADLGTALTVAQAEGRMSTTDAAHVIGRWADACGEPETCVSKVRVKRVIAATRRAIAEARATGTTLAPELSNADGATMRRILGFEGTGG